MIIEKARYAFWKGFNKSAFLDVKQIITNINKFITKLTEDKTNIDTFSQNEAYIDINIFNMILLSI